MHTGISEICFICAICEKFFVSPAFKFKKPVHSPFAKILLNELETKYQVKTLFHFEVLKGKFIDSRLLPVPRSGSFDNSDHEPGGAFIFIPKS